MKKTTEQASLYEHLDKMTTKNLLQSINNEDKKVPMAVEKKLHEIENLVEVVISKMQNGGRLFYLGAGTSGRLGVLDASECPPTFGVSDNLVIGLIAGGDIALRKAVENAEDNPDQAWEDLQQYNISDKDVLIGIAASGTTPYVIGGVKTAKRNGIVTGCITCNEGSPLSSEVQYPIEVIVGPEFVTGSTRMKAGTAQKLVLNMITTSVMIRLGRVKGNKMVNMELKNNKLVERGAKMIVEELGVELDEARKLLHHYKSVSKVLEVYKH